MKPVVVFDNIIYSLQRAGGISAFWSSLTQRIEASGQFECYYIEYKVGEDNLFRKKIIIPEEKIIKGKRLPLNVHRLLEPYIPPELTKNTFIFHSSYYRTFTHPRAINISTFHDLIHEHGADGNLITRPLMKGLHRRALEKSSHIISVSEATVNDIKEKFIKHREKNFTVGYNAPVNTFSSEISGSNDHSNTESYLLYVGARDDYKNFKTAVELSATLGKILKVVGAPFTKSEKKFLDGIKNSNVNLVEFPSESEMSSLYSRAIALLFLSEYEGFGIPIVEAQQYGCPVLALRRSAVPEVIGEGGILLDSLTTQDLTRAIGNLEDLSYRKALIEKGKVNALRFSWDKTAEIYMDIYKKYLGIK